MTVATTADALEREGVLLLFLAHATVEGVVVEEEVFSCPRDLKLMVGRWCRRVEAAHGGGVAARRGQAVALDRLARELCDVLRPVG
jgi:hypothetical protein